jgi:hypothetical protein
LFLSFDVRVIFLFLYRELGLLAGIGVVVPGSDFVISLGIRWRLVL